ncbi:hypothetical protein MYXO_01211 [Myxococcaceae bacterium]|nr:hypothetical protein MYXO_01211 [Myxococcaceae bacterium]
MSRRWIVAAASLPIALGAMAMVGIDGDAGTVDEPGTQSVSVGRDGPVAVARGIVDVEGGIVQLAASRDGIVRSVLVEEGERVREGQVLAMLDDRAAALGLSVAEAELAETRAALEPAEVRERAAVREHERLAKLARSEAVSRRALDQAADELRLARSELAARRAAIETAKAREIAARHEVFERSVRAPTDGTIVRRLARPGDGVSIQTVTTLFWLAPATPPIVRAEIEESFADRVTPGMEAEVVSESDESRGFAARVARVGRAFGPRRMTVHDPRDRADVRVLEVVLGFREPPEHLPLGQRVIVRFAPSHAGTTARPDALRD